MAYHTTASKYLPASCGGQIVRGVEGQGGKLPCNDSIDTLHHLSVVTVMAVLSGSILRSPKFSVTLVSPR